MTIHELRERDVLIAEIALNKWTEALLVALLKTNPGWALDFCEWFIGFVDAQSNQRSL